VNPLTRQQISAPGKIVLLGEWSVLKGAPALATSINARLKISTRAIDDEETPTVQSLGEKQAWSPGHEKIEGYFAYYSKIINEIIRRNNKAADFWQRQHIEITRDWKEVEGYGSSSALLAGLYLLQQNFLEQEGSFDEALKILQHLNSGQGSGIDLATQFAGGSILFQEKNYKAINLEKELSQILIVHTGQKRRSAQWLKKFSPNKDFCKTLAKSVEKFLLNRNWQKAVSEHHQALCQAGLVPDFIQEVAQEWQKKKYIYGLKSTGAGGGDALLVLPVKDKLPELKRDLSNRKWWIKPYKFGGEALKKENFSQVM